jgi:hypothetical protein
MTMMNEGWAKIGLDWSVEYRSKKTRSKEAGAIQSYLMHKSTTSIPTQA